MIVVALLAVVGPPARPWIVAIAIVMALFGIAVGGFLISSTLTALARGAVAEGEVLTVRPRAWPSYAQHGADERRRAWETIRSRVRVGRLGWRPAGRSNEGVDRRRKGQGSSQPRSGVVSARAANWCTQHKANPVLNQGGTCSRDEPLREMPRRDVEPRRCMRLESAGWGSSRGVYWGLQSARKGWRQK